MVNLVPLPLASEIHHILHSPFNTLHFSSISFLKSPINLDKHKKKKIEKISFNVKHYFHLHIDPLFTLVVHAIKAFQDILTISKAFQEEPEHSMPF